MAAGLWALPGPYSRTGSPSGRTWRAPPHHEDERAGELSDSWRVGDSIPSCLSLVYEWEIRTIHRRDRQEGPDPRATFPLACKSRVDRV